jgi:hypothetical protein
MLLASARSALPSSYSAEALFGGRARGSRGGSCGRTAQAGGPYGPAATGARPFVGIRPSRTPRRSRLVPPLTPSTRRAEHFGNAAFARPCSPSQRSRGAGGTNSGRHSRRRAKRRYPPAGSLPLRRTTALPGWDVAGARYIPWKAARAPVRIRAMSGPRRRADSAWRGAVGGGDRGVGGTHSARSVRHGCQPPSSVLVRVVTVGAKAAALGGVGPAPPAERRPLTAALTRSAVGRARVVVRRQAGAEDGGDGPRRDSRRRAGARVRRIARRAAAEQALVYAEAHGEPPPSRRSCTPKRTENRRQQALVHAGAHGEPPPRERARRRSCTPKRTEKPAEERAEMSGRRRREPAEKKKRPRKRGQNERERLGSALPVELPGMIEES